MEAFARTDTRTRVRAALAFAAVTGAYIGAAKFGFQLDVAQGVITPVWAPAGIALASLLLLGPRYWPAITIGAFVSNATSGVSVEVAAVISVGNTLEMLAAVYLLRRVDFRASFERVTDVLWFTGLAAFAATLIAATVGVTTLAVADSPAASPYDSAWILWWLGDAMGILLVAPAILVAARELPKLDRRRAIESLGLLALVAGTSAIVFLEGHWRYPYPVFGALVWATLRFRQLGAAVGSLVAASIAVAAAIYGDTPLGGDPTTAVQVLQGLLAFVSVSLLALGATLTEREEANERLAEAQRLAHLGSWEWDIKADRVTWSPELCRIFHVDARTKPKTFDGVLARVHPADRDAFRGKVEQAMETRQPFEILHRIILEDSSEIIVHGRGQVLVDAHGAPMRIVGTAQDVTERQRAEQVRDNILSAVSHELRTPLTAILGFALTLEERHGMLNDELRRRMTGQLASQALRLDRLLSNLLDVDRLRHGLIHVAVEPTDVAGLVHRTVAGIDTEDRRIDLTVQPVVANVDAAKVERMVENLVMNALKHTPPGTNVVVSVTTAGGDVLLAVDDSGPGIPDEQKREIFEPFARGNGTLAAGTGIGLALVAQFAALHGGRAWVEDSREGGASFRVALPLN
jgi:signal transduction histidine kinase